MSPPILQTLGMFSSTADGNPNAGVTEDAIGDLFGTTLLGGTANDGALFELPVNSTAPVVLATFTGTANGSHPEGGLIADAQGNLYGTTYDGGSAGDGVVFEWVKSSSFFVTLATFTGASGANPFASLTRDAAGNLFGTTASGGSANDGTVFELAKGSSSITTLAIFTGANGADPVSSLTEDAAGDLYGTTGSGGSANDGTVFELVKGARSVTTLATFTGANGAHPYAGLTFDVAGNIYGTTFDGGSANDGTVFELAKGASSIATLATFTAAGGVHPYAGLTIDGAGDFFGTTTGGAGATTNGITAGGVSVGGTTTGGVTTGGTTVNGVTTGGTTTGATTTGGTLTGGTTTSGARTTTGGTTTGGVTTGATTTGATTTGGVTTGGTTVNGVTTGGITTGGTTTGGTTTGGTTTGGTTMGGTQTDNGAVTGGGTVFELVKGASYVTTLATFSGANGADPLGGLTVDASGNLFGTTETGGSGGGGTVFLLTKAGFVPLPPVVGLASNPTATNTQSAALGTAATGFGADAIAVKLTSDADFLTGSTLALVNGNLIYKPGLVTAAQVGPDQLTYSVTDTVNGAVVTKTQTVTLGDGPAPAVSFVVAPTASNAHSAILGTVTAGLGTVASGGLVADGLAVTLISDAKFATGSALSLQAGQLVYNPGSITVAQIGADTLTYTVTNVVTGAVTSETQTVALQLALAFATFDGPNGANPVAGVTADAAGNIYGTTLQGGSSNDGTLFELAAGADSVTTLATFTGINGASPEAGLVSDAAGNLYGTVYGGNISKPDGSIFELVKGASSVTTLAVFDGSNGAHPNAGLFRDASGNLFGTTAAGGSAGDGTVFELAAGASSITTLATFTGPNGASPESDLIEDGAGNLYGTTSAGGANGDGTVFEIITSPLRTGPSIVTLATFGGANGAGPFGGLVADVAGNLYGTTLTGGGSNLGTVFELVKGTSSVSTLATFTGGNGANPSAGLLIDGGGNLFGTTDGGGSANAGTVFELVRGASSVITLATFTGDNGADPIGGLTVDAEGILRGTTETGTGNDGEAFELAGVGFVPLPPMVSLISHPTATNTLSAILGTAVVGLGSAAAGSRTGALAVALTSDADFATGSTLALVNGSLVYTPGLVTAAQAGSDRLTYTVIDGVTGSVTTETQTVTLSNGPAPVVTLATAPTATNAHTATLGTAVAGFGSDALTVALVSDADFATGSTLTLVNGNLVYTPGVVTIAKIGADTLSYNVTNRITGAVTTETQTVSLGNGPGPVVTLATTPSATNAQAATLGSVTTGFSKVAPGSLSVALTSDADFAIGSTLALSNGSLVYTPGAITAAKVGADVLSYTVTDTVTGAISTETQTVTLGTGPAPIITLARTPTATNALSATIGTAVAGFGTDALAVQLTLDADFATGSTLALSGGNLVYTPGLVTAAKAGTDLLKYTVTDTVTGAVTSKSQTVTLGNGPAPIVTLAATPTVSNAFSATLTTLASFTGANGVDPLAGLIADAAGNLYGTTQQGGSAGYGTVFELAHGATAVTVLASFATADGHYPTARLIADSAGNLYGTTEQGGSAGKGTVFELAHGAKAVTTLASFTGANGADPYSRA